MTNDAIRSNNAVKVGAGYSFAYGTLIWIISLFLSPFFWQFGLLVSGDFRGLSDFLPDYFNILMMAAVFSIPNWLIFSISIVLLGSISLTMPIRKVIIQFWAIALTIGLFAWIFGNPNDEEIWIATLSYILGLSVGIWFLPLKAKAIS